MPYVDVVTDPAALIRVAAVLRRVRDEIGTGPIDEATRVRLQHLLHNCVGQLRECLSPSLYAEVAHLVPADPDASSAEVRVGQAALLGWLDGVLHYVSLRQRQSTAKPSSLPASRS